MRKKQRYLCAAFALVTWMVVATSALASYPGKIQVTVEIWNDTAQDLHLNAATWFAAGTDLTPYGQAANEPTNTFGLTLNNPRNDSAAFSVGTGGKVCEFRLGHEKTFSWLGINPAPDKSASATSTGTVAAECSASVIKGAKSFEAYTVRFRIK